MKRGTCAVYIMTNRKRTVLYTGVTSDLLTRVAEHRAKSDPGSFASRYNTDRLVYFETTLDIESAIAREKQIKGWLRRRKIELIERVNREWKDLAADWSLWPVPAGLVILSRAAGAAKNRAAHDGVLSAATPRDPSLRSG